jgi:hypothetical protein
MKWLSITAVVCILSGALRADDTKSVPLADVAQHAVEQSKLTSPGSSPFHLRAKIVETTNPSSGYKAEIEEYWVSPEKWRRTITSRGFSQTLVVNADRISEQDTGDYFPWWLNDLVTAIFDPLPMLDEIRKVNTLLQKPSGAERSTTCARLQTKVGTPPAENSAFPVFCFEGSHGLLDSVFTPGYDAEFKDYWDFKGKRIARRLVIDPEPGTTIEAKLTEVSELKSPQEPMFAINQPTPSGERIKSVRVSEATARALSLLTPDIIWPTVRSGKTSGVLSMYVSVDRAGYVREAWPLNSDNAGLEDPARAQVMKWRFKPATVEGSRVQVETVLTFAFGTQIANSISALSDQEARKLATRIVEPRFPTGGVKGTEVKIQVGVSAGGSISGVTNPYNVPTDLFMVAANVVRLWRFRPYVKNGKPDTFSADIIFHVE